MRKQVFQVNTGQGSVQVGHAGGDVVVVNHYAEAPAWAGTATAAAPAKDDLLERKRALRQELWRARRSLYVNVPAALLCAWMAAVIIWALPALSGPSVFWTLSQRISRLEPTALLGALMAWGVLMTWLAHTRRPIYRLITQIRADLDDMEVVLRRRWGA